MNCPERETLIEYRHELLGARDFQIVSKHLSECEECRSIDAGFLVEDELLKEALRPRSADDALVQGVLDRLDDEPRDTPHREAE